MAGAHVPSVIDPARKSEVVENNSAFKPGQDAAPRRVEQLELNGSARLLLNNDRAIPNATTNHDVADLIFTTSQPRSLLSIARSNMARSRSLPSHQARSARPAPAAA